MKWCDQIQNEREVQQGLFLKQIIAENVQTLVSSLPQNSPIHRPLLKALGCVKKGKF